MDFLINNTGLLKAHFKCMQIKINGPLPPRVMVEDQVKKYLGKQDVLKSIGPELAEVTARPLSKIFDQSYRLGEMPEDWRTENVTPTYGKGRKKGTTGWSASP